MFVQADGYVPALCAPMVGFEVQSSLAPQSSPALLVIATKPTLHLARDSRVTGGEEFFTSDSAERRKFVNDKGQHGFSILWFNL